MNLRAKWNFKTMCKHKTQFVRTRAVQNKYAKCYDSYALVFTTTWTVGPVT